MKKWHELPPAQQQKLIDAAAENLDQYLYCDRDWGAWGYGTMREDDFCSAAEGDGPEEMAELMWNSMVEIMNNSNEEK